MKTYRLKPVLVPFFVLILFLVVLETSNTVLPPTPHGITETGQFIFLYFCKIVIWLSGAALLNGVVEIFVWEKVFSKNLEGSISQFIINFTAVGVYIFSVIAIITVVLEKEISGLMLLLLVVALVLGSFLRSKILGKFSGVSLGTDRPYGIGDWIEVFQDNGLTSFTGEVVDIKRKFIKLHEEDNSTVVVPMPLLQTMVVKNYKGAGTDTAFREVFNLDFSVKPERAKRVLLGGAMEAYESGGFVSNAKPEIKVIGTNDLGVAYGVTYWISAWNKITPAEASDKLNSTILEHLNKSGLKLAYPKEDIIYNENKPFSSEKTDLNEKLNILSKVELFDHFTTDELTRLASTINGKSFKQNGILIKQDNPGESMFILVEGLLDVFMAVESGSEIKVGQITPGHFFGEMSMLTGEPRTASVVAVTDIFTYEVTKENIQNILENRPALIDEIGQIIASRRMINIQKIEEAEKKSSSLTHDMIKKIKSFFKIN